MKVVILAGGFGTRISEETEFKPKPMIEIGERPILWHIMKYYSSYGFHDFIICAGYKQQIIKEWFANYFIYCGDITFDFRNGENHIEVRNSKLEPWNVTVVDTGLKTYTGGRIKKLKSLLGKEAFFLTYGDGVSNVNLNMLYENHKNNGGLVTVTAVKPEGRFGNLDVAGDKVTSFREKQMEDSGWINGGFMVLEPEVLDYIDGDHVMLEEEPFDRISREGRLFCYRHNGFWQCMDTLRDKNKLEDLWDKGTAPWKIW